MASGVNSLAQPGAFTPHTAGEAATQLESVLVKQLLVSSGAFKGGEAAGSGLTQELFAETLADAVAKSGGFGVAPLIAGTLPTVGGTPAAPNLPHFTTAAPLPGVAAGLMHGDFGAVTSEFGTRADPITHQASNHPGIDLAAATGTPIPAAQDGVVIAVGPRGGYGNAVEVAHADGTTTLYAHASEVLVTQGEQVRAGEPVALVGQTGRTTGPHLHLEVRQGGHPINPRSALKSYRLRAEEPGGDEP